MIQPGKKRITILLISAVIVLLGLALTRLSRRSSIDPHTFATQLPVELGEAGYHVLEVRTYAPHLISQSQRIHLPAALAKKLGWSSIGYGSPESGLQIWAESSSKIRLLCLVRSNEENVLGVAILYPADAESEAKTLRSALTKAFPQVIIDLKLNQDEPSQVP